MSMLKVALFATMAIAPLQAASAARKPPKIAHVHDQEPCGFRYLASGGAGRTLLSCGAGDLVQSVAAAPAEATPLPGEEMTASAGDLLYREAARVAVVSAFVASPAKIALPSKKFWPIPQGETLRAYDIAGRTAYCQVDVAALSPDEMRRLTLRRGPFTGVSYGALCLNDSDGDGAFDRVFERGLGQSQFTAMAMTPMKYSLSTRFYPAMAKEGDRVAPIDMAVRLVAVSPETVRISFPAISGAARATFEGAGMPVRHDPVLTVPLVDGAGSVTERGLTITLKTIADNEIAYSVQGAISDWFGIEGRFVHAAAAPPLTDALASSTTSPPRRSPAP